MAADTGMGKILEVEGLRHRYPNGRVALDGVDLSIGAGEALVLLGANGSGKTTLLLHLNGLLQGEGRITVGGEVLTPATVRRVREQVGLIFQDSDDQLFMPTVREDVAFGLRQRGMAAGEAGRQAEEMLASLGIAELAGRAPYQLSAGEKKRVALAGVLILKPALLVLDEPTTYLDPPGQRDLITLLRRLPQAKLVATHDVDFAEAIAPRAVFLTSGRVSDSGTPTELALRYRWRVVERVEG
jgi:cobalt/nickel transport system ATP-binding protein